MNGGGIGKEGPSKTLPLQVVMDFNSPFGLAMVLLGSGPEPEVEACMRTRSFLNQVSKTSTNPNPKGHNRRSSKQRVEPFSLEEAPVVTMADQHIMAELLCAAAKGYAEAFVVPPIPAEHFELKHSLINLKDVPESSIKLVLFPFAIDGPARIWLDKEPSRSILT
nr:hypothetical protein [Tanacetum cinerariifolium]